MIKNYSTYIKESIEEYDYEDEEDFPWDEEDMLINVPMNQLRVGMKVQCIKDCDIESARDYNHPIKEGEIKTIRGYGGPEWIYFDDTPGGHGSYRKEYFVKI